MKTSQSHIKVLIDTSVWIDFFNGSLSEKQREAIVSLLDAEEVVITSVIKNELLVGATSLKNYLELENNLSAFQEFHLTEDSLPAFNRFSFDLKQKGILGKYTDVSIAFLAQKNEIPLWSFDRYFTQLKAKKMIEIFEV